MVDKGDIVRASLLVVFCGALFGFCTYLSSVPVGEPSNGMPTASQADDEDDDDDIGPINRDLGLGTNEIDDFLGLR